MCCGYPSRVLTVFIFRPLSPARRDSGCPERLTNMLLRTNQESVVFQGNPELYFPYDTP